MGVQTENELAGKSVSETKVLQRKGPTLDQLTSEVLEKLSDSQTE